MPPSPPSLPPSPPAHPSPPSPPPLALNDIVTDDSTIVDDISEYALEHLASNASGGCTVLEGGVTVCEETTDMPNATNSSIWVAVYSSMPDQPVGDGDTTISMTGDDDESAVVVTVLEGEAAEAAVDDAQEGVMESTLLSDVVDIVILTPEGNGSAGSSPVVATASFGIAPSAIAALGGFGGAICSIPTVTGVLFQGEGTDDDCKVLTRAPISASLAPW